MSSRPSLEEPGIALGQRRWLGGESDEPEPVLVWLHRCADESMFALHLGNTELRIRPHDLEVAMAAVVA